MPKQGLEKSHLPMEHGRKRKATILDKLLVGRPRPRAAFTERYCSYFDLVSDDVIDIIIAYIDATDYLSVCRAWSDSMLRGVLRRELRHGHLQNVTLNTQQVDAIVRFLAGQSVFLTGMGGTGKSFVLRLIVTLAMQSLGNDAVKVCATTSAASAELLRSGMHVHVSTVHSLLNAKQAIDEEGNCEYVPKPPYELQTLRVLFLDEVSMLSADLFDVLHDSLHPDCQVIASGDMLQLQPVNAAPVFVSKPFLQLKVIELCVNVRASGAGPIAVRFRDLLKRLRLGKATWKDMVWLRDNSLQNDVNDSALFAKNKACCSLNAKRFAELEGSAVCFRAVDELQTQQWQRPSDYAKMIVVRYYTEPMSDALMNTKTNGQREWMGEAPSLTVAEKDALAPPVDCDSELQLKVGLCVVLTRAVWAVPDYEKGDAQNDSDDVDTHDDGGDEDVKSVRSKRVLVAANGDVGIVSHLSTTEVRVAFLKYDAADDDVDKTLEVVVKRVPYKRGCRVCSRTLLQRIWVRRQFPLRIGYARTVHKAQGATLCQPTHMNANDVIYKDGIVPPSIIYTMISRARSVSQIHFARSNGVVFDPRCARPDRDALEYHRKATINYKPLLATLMTVQCKA